MKKLSIYLIALLTSAMIITRCNKEVVPEASTDEGIYEILQEPLVGTFMYEGKTLSVSNPGQQKFEYVFAGWMTDQPYKITLSRNVLSEDCVGCIGDSYVGRLSKPTYRDSTIPLKEFIIQMVKAKDNIYTGDDNIMVWKAGGYTWKVADSDKENFRLVEVTSSYGKQWKILIKA